MIIYNWIANLPFTKLYHLAFLLSHISNLTSTIDYSCTMYILASWILLKKKIFLSQFLIFKHFTKNLYNSINDDKEHRIAVELQRYGEEKKYNATITILADDKLSKSKDVTGGFKL